MKKIQQTEKLFSIALIMLISANAFAQGGFNVHSEAKTMHYWRGLRVTDAFMIGTSAGYFGDSFSAFVWGGLSLNGEYKEVTPVISYSTGNFSATLIDINNFSGLEKIDYFNFDAETTNHIVDLTLGYDFTFMHVAWSTILYGNDRITGTGHQRYSTYVEFGFPVKVNKTSVTPFIAPAFALNGDAETMIYGDDEKAGIANVGFRVNRIVEISDYKLPVTAEVGFNTALEQASVQLSLNLF
ncbi:MAG: hypothetical protein U5L09_17375 [Bacteroidales bacterium]|nr:hypothetical protein [Bacteroidales bacterium]